MYIGTVSVLETASDSPFNTQFKVEMMKNNIPPPRKKQQQQQQVILSIKSGRNIITGLHWMLNDNKSVLL